LSTVSDFGNLYKVSPCEYATAICGYIEHLKILIIPLLEQTIAIDEEHKLSKEINKIVFESD